MLLLQVLNAIRLEESAPYGVSLNMANFIQRSPNPNIYPATREDIIRILGMPVPGEQQKPYEDKRENPENHHRMADNLFPEPVEDDDAHRDLSGEEIGNILEYNVAVNKRYRLQ